MENAEVLVLYKQDNTLLELCLKESNLTEYKMNTNLTFTPIRLDHLFFPSILILEIHFSHLLQETGSRLE